jgi:hypothetical protein
MPRVEDIASAVADFTIGTVLVMITMATADRRSRAPRSHWRRANPPGRGVVRGGAENSAVDGGGAPPPS